MQCNRCGAMLPPGAPTCPYCANPTPYNVGSSPQNVYAPPPSTSYGQTPYPSPAQVPYGQTPYPPPQVPYGQPPYPPPPQVPYGPPMVPVMPQPRKQSGGASAAIIVLAVLLVLACGIGGLYIATQNNKTTNMNNNATAAAGNATFSAQLTPTPYPPYTESDSPSKATFSGAAQQVIPSAQLAGSVDSSHQPVTLQSKFRSGDTIYLSYKWAQGNTGYVQTRWYVNGEMKDEIMSNYLTQYSNGYGYHAKSFSTYGATLQGTVEVFWCQDSACTHGGLAWARPFSVTAS